ncbi:MAG: glycosyltransferase family 4 protein [Candidatus Latescibacteria bacterium]|nr:glycosyltransferase family 4 protein [Candidatus Latescibacterota bacterium]
MKSFLRRLRGWVLQPQISLFHEFRPPPYGGANQFFMALRTQLQQRGYTVSDNVIASKTKSCLLNSFAFDVDLLRKLNRKNCTIVHRVDGPVGTYRGTDHTIDEQVAQLNQEFADATIFQSHYSLQANLDLGFKFKNPTVVLNAADHRIFARKTLPFDPNRKIKLIATSWSDHPNKGGPVYKWLDTQLDWDRFEFTFVGRTQFEFQNIKSLPAVPSQELATLLQQHDIYITASLHESCSNALIEALSVGLPAIYVQSGGNAEIVNQAGFGFTDKAEIPSLLQRLADEYQNRQAQITLSTLDEVVDQYLLAMHIGRSL